MGDAEHEMLAMDAAGVDDEDDIGVDVIGRGERERLIVPIWNVISKVKQNTTKCTHVLRTLQCSL